MSQFIFQGSSKGFIVSLSGGGGGGGGGTLTDPHNSGDPATYDMQLADNGKTIIVTDTQVNSYKINVPPSASVGFTFSVQVQGTGDITVASAADTFFGLNGNLGLATNTVGNTGSDSATFTKTGANRWDLSSEIGSWQSS